MGKSELKHGSDKYRERETQLWKWKTNGHDCLLN